MKMVHNWGRLVFLGILLAFVLPAAMANPPGGAGGGGHGAGGQGGGHAGYGGRGGVYPQGVGRGGYAATRGYGYGQRSGPYGRYGRGGHGYYGYHGYRYYRGGWYPYGIGFFGLGYAGYPYGYGYGYPYDYSYYDYDSGYNASLSSNRSSNVSPEIAVQAELRRQGYYEGSVDGVIGEGTRRAIREYQEDHGLPVNGRISLGLLSSLKLR